MSECLNAFWGELLYQGHQLGVQLLSGSTDSLVVFRGEVVKLSSDLSRRDYFKEGTSSNEEKSYKLPITATSSSFCDIQTD